MTGMKETKRKVSAVSWHVVADELRDAVRHDRPICVHTVTPDPAPRRNARQRTTPRGALRCRACFKRTKKRKKMADDDSK